MIEEAESQFDQYLDELLYELTPRHAELLVAIMEMGAVERHELLAELRALAVSATGAGEAGEDAEASEDA